MLSKSIHSILLIAVTCTAVWADEPRIVERFEGVEPSWEVRSSQQSILVHKHHRTNAEKKSGNQSEFIHFKTSQRSNASLVHTLKKSQVINDYCPFIWIKSNQESIKLSVRVVLPQTPNPVGKGPLQVLVELNQSSSTQQWERLGCEPGKLIHQLNARLRSIQYQFNDLKIDTADAYCDLLVLSGFDRPNTEYQIWLDDLSHLGFLPARKLSPDAGSFADHHATHQQVKLLDSRFRVNGKPFFLRAVKHNGESLAFLKQLGFNAVVLDRLPTNSELDQAQQYQVWIVCPPELFDRGATRELLESKNLEMIFCWDLGQALTSKDLAAARQMSERIKQVTHELDRPAFCQSHMPMSRASKYIDFLRLNQLTYGTTFTLQRFRSYLATMKDSTSPFIVDIQSQLPFSILEQAALLPQPIGNGLLTRDQISRLVFEALNAGARGLIFHASTNLQKESEQSQWLVPIFRSINRELIQMDPWIAGGTYKSLKKPDFAAVSFDLPRSQLTIVFNDPNVVMQENERVRRRTGSLEISTSQQAPRVYKILETGVVPILHQSSIGKLNLELTSDPGWERFVVSEDSLSFEYIQQATQSFSVDGGILRDKFLVHEDAIERLKQLVDSLSPNEIKSPSLFQSIQELEKSLKMLRTFLAKNQTTTVQALLARSRSRLAIVANSLEQELLASRKLINSSFNSDFDQLGNYIALEKLLQKVRWSDNLLPSGRFDSLALMSKSGWEQHLNSSSRVHSSVSLQQKDKSIQDDRHGGRVLRIQTWNESESNQLVPITPVWLESPKVKVSKGQVIRIDGYIRVDNPITDSLDGFMVLDAIGGPELGTRFYKTDGWRYFAIERIAPRDMDFGLILAQTGIGLVDVANLQLRICDLSAAGTQSTEGQGIAGR